MSCSPIHDRAPVLIPAEFATEWLNSDQPLRNLVDNTLTRAGSMQEHIAATPILKRP